MEKQLQRWWWRILCGLPALLLFHCSAPQMAVYDDALDIKPERQFAYEVAPCIDTTNPDGNRRDGRTLRGQVLELVILAQDTTRKDTFFVFLNKGVADPERCVEHIPLRDVILPALDSPMVRNQWNNINKIRSYNNVTGIPEIREVPVRVITDCGCDPLRLTFHFRPRIGWKCPKRTCFPLFVELRAVPAVFSYADHPTRLSTEYRKQFTGEIAIGWRFGVHTFDAFLKEKAPPCDKKTTLTEFSSDAPQDFCYRWGIGLAFTSPLGIYNALSPTPPEDINRPALLLHLRYQFDRTFACVRPFVYAQAGVALDRATRKLWKFRIAGDADIDAAVDAIDLDTTCFNFYLPYGAILPSLRLLLDVGLPPITWSIGAGLEFPLFSWLDIAADIGYRSWGIADLLRYQGTEIPVPRRVGQWRLRIGVTL